jgi:PTS system nitrogen regulatory IIA component
MASRDLTVEELAIFLHITPEQVNKLASRDKLPGRRIKGHWRFSESEIHHWMEDKIGESSIEDLLKVEEMLNRSPRDFNVPVSLVDFMFEEAISIPLPARTRNSVVREMCELVSRTGLMWNTDEMIEAVAAREQLHPTALENGVAMLHPRRPRSSILAQPIIALGISSQPIPFGNRAGYLTDVFFLICSTDDSIHLKILARLSRLISDPKWLQQLRSAALPSEVLELVKSGEQAMSPIGA